MSQRQLLITSITNFIANTEQKMKSDLFTRIENVISKDVCDLVNKLQFSTISIDDLKQISKIVDYVVDDSIKHSSKQIPDEPENVKMSVTKQCVRRVNCLTDSSMNASNMRFINSYKRLELGKDVLVYSYIVVLKGFCKNCSFSKTYNLIIDLDKIDTDILRSFHKELIKHYCKEMSEKYPQLRGKISYDECLRTLSKTIKRALESIEGELEAAKSKEVEESKKEARRKAIMSSSDEELDNALRNYMKNLKPSKKQSLNPLDFEFKDEEEFQYFIHLPLDLQLEYSRTHLKIHLRESKNKPSEIIKRMNSAETSTGDVYSTALDTSFVC